MVKTIRRFGTLLCVCAVLALTFAGCGDTSSKHKSTHATQPRKTDSVVDLRTEEEIAVDDMKTELGANKPVDISDLVLPDSVTKVYAGDKGYVIYLTVEGYQPGMEIVCGITTDGKVVNALCLASHESLGKEKTYGENFVGKGAASVEAVDTIAGATYTTLAYKKAVKDALTAVLVLKGDEVDLRTEEEIEADAFEDNFRDDPIVSACSLSGLNNNITAVQKTKMGNYVIDVNGLGFGYYGSTNHYQPAKNIPIAIRVYISAEGKIIDTLTVSHAETNGMGAVCGKESYYSQFDGKTADTYTEVDGIAGATITTNGYLTAIKRCFEAVAILEEGAES